MIQVGTCSRSLPPAMPRLRLRMAPVVLILVFGACNPESLPPVASSLGPRVTIRGPLLSGATVDDPSWRRDGLAVVMDSDSPPGIVVVDVLTGAAHSLTHNAYHNTPNYSPTDDRIAYDDRQNGGVWLLDENGVSTELISGFAELQDRSWSPDGTKILVRKDGALVVIDVRTREWRVLASPDDLGNVPSLLRWCESGRDIVGLLYPNVVKVDTSDGEVVVIDDMPNGIAIPGPSGDLWGRPNRGTLGPLHDRSNWLVRLPPIGNLELADLQGDVRGFDVHSSTGWVAAAVGRTGIAIVDPHSLEIYWVANDIDPYAIAWSPDGKHLAYVAYVAGDFLLFVADIEWPDVQPSGSR